MHRRWLITLSVCICLSITAAALQAEPPAKIQVLMVTGDDVAPYHDWREISEATRDVLVRSGKFDVRVCDRQRRWSSTT